MIRPRTAVVDVTSPQFGLTSPAIDFVRLAESFGVPATGATTAEELTEQLSNALAEPGPHLIQAVVPPAA
ncbi:thiamine pyrophosphate-dependent enzyme [Micromonospora sp. NPDC048835]|uniref:thiamine pyrophosphate-dependent enzyme n=1 Tax=Micromonospora sp. NPDC048835 TaxID=3155147 RepID=UPI003402A483